MKSTDVRDTSYNEDWVVFYTIIELLPAITSLASFLLTGIILTFTLGIILSFVKKILKIISAHVA